MHSSAFLASVIFAHSAVLVGLKKGGELAVVGSQTLEIIATVLERGVWRETTTALAKTSFSFKVLATVHFM